MMELHNLLFEKKLSNDISFFSKKFKFILSKYTKKIKKQIKKAIFYSLFPGGKRIRPILLFASGEIFNIKKDLLLYPAFSIELIHNYSLIHDDLPSMDNDDYRRGKLTLHRKFGEAKAILVGDGLLTLAFEILSDWKYNLSVVLKIIKLIASSCGISGLIEGQVMDLEALKLKAYNKKYLKNMCTKKTASLIQTAILIPGILKNISKDKLEILKKIGTNIGLLFQITDDLIDYLSGQDKDKFCYPKIFGLEKTKKIISTLVYETKKLIFKNFGKKNTKYLNFLIDKIAKRKK